jgi:hypothetical protein
MRLSLAVTLAVLVAVAAPSVFAVEVDYQFVALGRLAYVPEARSWEYALYEGDDTSQTDAQGDYSYGNNQAFDWSLEYDADGDLLEWYYGGQDAISIDLSDLCVDELKIFAQARPGNGTTSQSVAVSDLVLQAGGGTLNGSDILSTDATGDYYAFTPASYTGDWILTGTTTFAWEGTRPGGNRMQFWIKGGCEPTPPIPEPATLTLFGLGAALFAARRRRR